MPFAVADSLSQRGIAPVLFALRGACDPARVECFRHHWISVGQVGRATKLFRSEGCRDLIFIGGLSAVHQFTRIGPQVMVGGVCGVRGDIIPFGLANGQYASLEGLNIIGMKRRKFTKERLATVRAFYQKLFHGPGIFAERLNAVQPLAAEDPAIAEILGFIAQGKHRALCLPADDGNKQ